MTLQSKNLGDPRTWLPGYLDAGWLDAWLPGYPVIWVTHGLKTWLLGYLATWMVE